MAAPADRLKALTPAERNVLALKGNGFDARQIADELRGGLDIDAVENMLMVIRFKLDGAGAEPSVDYLVDFATREHVAAMKAGHEYVEHAIAAGDALLRAEQQIPEKKRDDWIRSTLGSWPQSAPYAYMRIAKHREQVRAAGAATLRDALDATTPRGKTKPGSQPGSAKTVDLTKARREREERDRAQAVLAFGGGLAQAWVSVGMALEQLDAALSEVMTGSQRRDIAVATSRLRRVQDDLVSVARESERKAA